MDKPIYLQSGVIAFRRDPSGLQILLVTSRSGKRWVIPKGLVEPDLSAAESASKEALEEAGIEGELTEPSIGEFSYTKWSGTCVVEVFLFNVHTLHENWEEDFRIREWFSPAEAAERVREPELGEILGNLPEFI